MWPWFQKPDSFSMAIKKVFYFLISFGVFFFATKEVAKD
jgi:hypothetical protein